MDGKSHIVGGIAGGLLFMAMREESRTIVDAGMILLGSGFGALLPDIDMRTSMLGRYLPFGYFLEHRTITHSLFFIAVVAIIAYALHAPGDVIWGLCVGVVSHLLLDAWTPMGLPWLMFPLATKDKKRYRRKHF